MFDALCIRDTLFAFLVNAAVENINDNDADLFYTSLFALY